MIALALSVLAINSTPHPPAGRISFRAAVVLTHDSATLGQLADLSALPSALRKQAADLEILELAPRRTSLRISTRILASRVAGMMPSLSAWLPANYDATEHIRIELQQEDYPAGIAEERSTCWQATVPVEAGEIAARSSFAPIPCPVSPARAEFIYDPATRAPRARRRLAPGDVVRAEVGAPLAAIAPGVRLALRTHIGAVVVDREVQAVQAGRGDKPLFVRSADGQVFSVPAPAVEQ